MELEELIATIGVRVLGISFLLTAIIEILILATDFVCVKTGMYLRSEVAFVPRVMLAAFYSIAAAYLLYQSKGLVKFLIHGLDNPYQLSSTDEQADKSAQS